METANIPMGFTHQSINWGTPLGARGGMTRDATGYGYRTIRYACDVIAKDLVKYNSIKPYRRFKMTDWADQLFLNLIKQRPDVIPNTLMQIANKMSPDRFAAFMMMRSPIDLIHIFRSCSCQVIYLCAPWEVSVDLSLILASCFISLVGLPHGALDPVIAHRCGLIHDLRSSVRFFAGYIIVVALVVLFWLTLPPASLLLFLLISCIHFGRDWKQKVSFGGFAYGAFVLGLPAWTAPEQVEQIFSFLIFQNVAEIPLIFLQGLGVIGILLLIFDRDKIISPHRRRTSYFNNLCDQL